MKKYVGIVTCLAVLVSVQQLSGTSKVKKFFGGSKQSSGEGKIFEFAETSNLNSQTGLSRPSAESVQERLDTPPPLLNIWGSKTTEATDDMTASTPGLPPPPPKLTVPTLPADGTSKFATQRPNLPPTTQEFTEQPTARRLDQEKQRKTPSQYEVSSSRLRNAMINNPETQITRDTLKLLSNDDLVKVYRGLEDRKNTEGMNVFFREIAPDKLTGKGETERFRNALLQEPIRTANDVKTPRDSQNAVKKILKSIADLPVTIAMAPVKLSNTVIKKLQPGFKAAANESVVSTQKADAKNIKDYIEKNGPLIQLAGWMGPRANTLLVNRILKQYPVSRQYIKDSLSAYRKGELDRIPDYQGAKEYNEFRSRMQKQDEVKGSSPLL